MTSTRPLALLAPLAFTACFPALPTSEHGTLVLTDSGLFDPTSLNGGAGAGNVIAGTKLCPTLGHPVPGPNIVDVTSCFTPAVDGPARADGDECITFGDDGDVTWTFTPAATCTAAGFTPAVDDFKFHSVSPAHAHLTTFARLDIAAQQSLNGNVALVSRQQFPAGWSTAAALFANRPLRPTLGFVDDAGATVEYVARDATVSLAGDGAFLLDENAATPLVEAKAGGTVELALTIGGRVYAAPALAVDDITDITSMEPVVFAFGEAATRGKNVLPIVRAFVTDRNDRVVAGAPVAWTIVEGGASAVVAPLGVLEGTPVDDAGQPSPFAEWVSVADCKPPPSPWEIYGEDRSLTLEARLDRFVDDIPIKWHVDAAKSDDDRAQFNVPAGCPPRDQGCASTPGAPMFAVLIALGSRRRTISESWNARTTPLA